MPEQYDNEQYRRDIDEILREAGADHLPPRPEPSPKPRQSGGFPDWRPKSPTQVMLIGGILLALTYLRLAGPFSSAFALIGIALLAIGLFTWVLRPPRSDGYWRGRRVNWNESESWWTRLYHSIYRDP